jgi:DNA-binding response OmpR family regulator
MSRTFEGENFEVEWFAEPEVGLAAVRRRTFDLLVVDVGDHGEATSLCRVIRAESAHPDVPLIAATSNAEVHAEALVAGADESVLKSLSGREILARVAAVLRRAAPNFEEKAAYDDDEVRIYPDTMRVIRGSHQIYLSKGEADVLSLLLRHAPMSMSVERIRAELNEDSTPVTRSAIEARLKSLRRKIGSDLITNRIGYGYSFGRGQV